jgi:capsular exopolysaccharide synthesis family protein
MSRIHEALKKAELERASGAGTAAIALPVEHAPETRPSAPQHEADTTGSPLTVEKLIHGCRQVHWRPEPKTALLFNAANHVQGSEELRTLRSRLYQIRDRQPLRTILISSALPAEGKTFLTANLAHMIVRQHERRALIIDADLRRSQLHDLLGAPGEPGLTEYLRGQADELSIIQRGSYDRLFFIPGGKPASNPAELLANGRLKTLLERVSPLFDWVLLDSPPALPVADSSAMADLCDGVLLVVRAASTSFDLAQRARDEFRQKGLVGVVLNQVEAGMAYNSYYYHYYQGNKGK